MLKRGIKSSSSYWHLINIHTNQISVISSLLRNLWNRKSRIRGSVWG